MPPRQRARVGGRAEGGGTVRQWGGEQGCWDHALLQCTAKGGCSAEAGPAQGVWGGCTGDPFQPKSPPWGCLCSCREPGGFQDGYPSWGYRGLGVKRSKRLRRGHRELTLVQRLPCSWPSRGLCQRCTMQGVPRRCARARQRLLGARQHLLGARQHLLGQSEESLPLCFSLCRESAVLQVLSFPPWDKPAGSQRAAALFFSPVAYVLQRWCAKREADGSGCGFLPPLPQHPAVTRVCTV